MIRVLAVILAIAALPPLAARASGGQPPDPVPKLAALAPVAALPAAVAAVIAATTASWWLTVLLAIPAAVLLAWQLPAPKRTGRRHAAGPLPGSEAGPGLLTLRVLTVNAQCGSADPVAVVGDLRRYGVEVLAVQELTPGMAGGLAAAGLADLLPFCHLDPRPGYPGAGLWARWPLTPLPPVPGMQAAAPRARIDPLGGWPLILTTVHPIAPVKGRDHEWRRELESLRSVLAVADGPQVVAGDFNASQDHRLFRALLAAGFLDCADAARSRSWPGFTWPVARGIPPVMRLDHVLVSRAGAAVSQARTVQIPGTDHRGVLAVIELKLAS